MAEKIDYSQGIYDANQLGTPKLLILGAQHMLSLIHISGPGAARRCCAVKYCPCWRLVSCAACCLWPLGDRTSPRLNSSHVKRSRMPSSA